MGIKTIMMILATLSFSVSALADHHEGESKPFSITGDFGASFNFYGNEYATDSSTTPAAAKNNHSDANLDLVQINLEKNWSKSKLYLSIGYGSVANAVNFGASNNGAAGANLSVNSLNVMQAYYHMTTSYGLGVTFGKFMSPVGHETYNMMDNMQWNRSFGFLLAPFFSTGLNLTYGSDMWAVGFIASNGQGRDVDADKNKTMALTVDVDPMENLAFDLRYVTGTEANAGSATANLVNNHQVSILDFTASYMINEMFDVALNYISHAQKEGNGGRDVEASSIAAYVNAHFGLYHLGLRYEQFAYDAGILLANGAGAAPVGAVGADNSISSITVTAKAEIDQNAHVVLEYKMDSSDDAIYANSDATSTEDSNNTLTLGLLYRF